MADSHTPDSSITVAKTVLHYNRNINNTKKKGNKRQTPIEKEENQKETKKAEWNIYIYFESHAITSWWQNATQAFFYTGARILILEPWRAALDVTSSMTYNLLESYVIPISVAFKTMDDGHWHTCHNQLVYLKSNKMKDENKTATWK